MANTINKAEKYLKLIDSIYKQGSLTTMLDTPEVKGMFSEANKIKVMKTVVTGMGNYNRDTGYPKMSDITVTWDEYTLTQERGKQLSMDRMDNEETMYAAWGSILNKFMTEQVIPELDAYRFSKIATGGKTSKSEDLTTEENVLAAIDEAIKTQDAEEVPSEGRMLFVNTNLKPLLNKLALRVYNGESNINTNTYGYNGIPIFYVPPTRFYDQITLKDGSSEFGFEKGSGKEINFILMRKDSIMQAVKIQQPKLFSADINQTADKELFQFRLYHDLLVYKQKTNGIYTNKKSS